VGLDHLDLPLLQVHQDLLDLLDYLQLQVKLKLLQEHQSKGLRQKEFM
jgi:hypothetical protein